MNAAMTSTSMPEMRRDLSDTLTDIKNLNSIITGLEGFTQHRGDEPNRDHITKLDTYKYKSILAEAVELEKQIRTAIQQAETQQTPMNKIPIKITQAFEQLRIKYPTQGIHITTGYRKYQHNLNTLEIEHTIHILDRINPQTNKLFSAPTLHEALTQALQ
jgi:hypothetical protein